jgi:hypothetical protein
MGEIQGTAKFVRQIGGNMPFQLDLRPILLHHGVFRDSDTLPNLTHLGWHFTRPEDVTALICLLSDTPSVTTSKL